MIKIKLKADLEARSPRPRRHRLFRVMVACVLVVVAVLLVERWRGQWALNRWKHQMAAKGEVFERNRIWAHPSDQGMAFSNELHRAVAQLPPGLNRYAGQVSAIVIQEPGTARRGSQEPNPVLNPSRDGTNTWQELEARVEQAQPALESLRSILRNPPPDNLEP